MSGVFAIAGVFGIARRLIAALLAPISLLIFGPSDGTVLISDHTMSRMIELTTRPPFCHLHTDRGTIRNMMFSSDPRKIRQMSEDSVSKLEDVCRAGVKSGHQGGFIYPGTKWCGPGNIALNYTDLGYHFKEDMCCREHDNCKTFLNAGECKQGICNTSPYTRSHCDCDASLRKCLQNVNTETANTIGAIFFNVAQIICFRERNPCSQWQSSNKNIQNDDVSNSINGDSGKGNSESGDCEVIFQRSERYIGSPVRFLTWDQKPEFFFNMLLRKLRFL